MLLLLQSLTPKDGSLTVDCKSHVKNLVARRANEKPSHCTIYFPEHAMEAILITTLGTYFKFFTSVYLMYLVIHLTYLRMRSIKTQ